LSNTWSNIYSPFSFMDHTYGLPSYYIQDNKLYTLHPTTSSSGTSYLGYYNSVTNLWVQEPTITTTNFELLYPNTTTGAGGIIHFKAYNHKSGKIFVDDYNLSSQFDWVLPVVNQVKYISNKRSVFVKVDSTECYSNQDSLIIYAKLLLSGAFNGGNLLINLKHPVINNSILLENLSGIYSSNQQYLYRTYKIHKDKLGYLLSGQSIQGTDTIESFNKFKVNNSIKYAPSQVNINAYPSANICSGSPVGVILSVPSGGCTWYLNGNIIPNQSASSYTATSLGSYTVSIRNSSGCSITTSPIVIQNTPLPTTSISSNGINSICSGSFVVLTSSSIANATGNLTYQWKKDGINIVGATSSTYNATSAGEYTLDVINSNGCQATASPINLTTNLLPTVSISSTQSMNVCSGTAVTLTSNATSNATGNILYQWKKDGIDISGATSATYNPTMSGQYTLEVTNSNGCKAISNASVLVVNLLPTTSISSNGVNSICSGSSVMITSSSIANATGNLTYQWKKGGINIFGATSSTYNATMSGQYTLDVINSNGCQVTSSIIILTTISSPTVSISSAGQTTICAGDSATLTSNVTSNATGNILYQWKKDGIDISNATNSNYTAKTSGQYTLEVTNSNGCKAISNTSVLVINLLPTTSISSNGVNSICSGSFVELTSSSISNATGNLTYQWKKDGINIFGATNPTYNATMSGQYTLEVTNSNGCKATSSVIILTTNSSPTVNISTAGQSTICAGDSVVLTSNATSNATGNILYQWKKDGIDISNATNSNYTAKTSGQYTLEVTNSNGCKAISNTFVLVVNLLPTTSISSNGVNSICSGSSVMLTSSSTGILTYQWKKDGINILGATNPTYNATMSGQYALDVYLISSGCQATSNIINLTTNTLPIVSISAASQTTICAGDSVILTSNVTSNAPGNGLFQWKKDGIPIIKANYSSYIAKTNGQYTLEVTNSNLCQATSSAISLIINSLPIVNISYVGTTLICAGDSATLNSTVIPNASGNSIYQWKKDGINIIGASSSTYNATLRGQYTLDVINSNGCLKSSNSIVILVDTSDIGNIKGDTINIIPNTLYVYSVKNLTNINYNWAIQNGVINAGQGTNKLTVKWFNNSKANLSCVVINNNNCMYSSILAFNINSTGINDIKNSNIKIYPNPTNNIINIEGLNKNENNTIQFFDVQGKLVITKNITEKGTVDLSELNKGVYVIKIGELAQKIVKM
jgi:hypothetical protein